MRTRNLLLTVLSASALCLLPAAASAQTEIGSSRRIGLGLTLGYPDVGFAANFFLSPKNSLQLSASWGWNPDHSSAAIRGDFLFWMPTITQGNFGALRWYVGPGLFVGWAPGRWCRGFGNNCYAGGGAYLGAEAAIGIGFQFRRVPIDLMLEAVPRLGLVHPDGFGPWFHVSGALHVRYYF